MRKFFNKKIFPLIPLSHFIKVGGGVKADYYGVILKNKILNLSFIQAGEESVYREKNIILNIFARNYMFIILSFR